MKKSPRKREYKSEHAYIRTILKGLKKRSLPKAPPKKNISKPVGLYEEQSNGVGIVYIQRKCLGCGKQFPSASKGNRICGRCKNSVDYR